MKSGNLVATLTVLALCLTSCRGPAKVWRLVASPSGKQHAAILVDWGNSLNGAVGYVAVFRGEPQTLDSEVSVKGLCYLWKAYRVDLWKVTWESENQLALAVDGPIPKDYEEMIRLKTCDGISARWYLEERESKTK